MNSDINYIIDGISHHCSQRHFGVGVCVAPSGGSCAGSNPGSAKFFINNFLSRIFAFKAIPRKKISTIFLEQFLGIEKRI